MIYLIDSLLFCTLVAWLAFYVEICRSARSVLRRPAPPQPTLAQDCLQIFCVVSVVAMPVLMGFLAWRIGPVGCMGTSVCGLCVWLTERYCYPAKLALAMALFIVGLDLLLFAILYSVPDSPLPAMFPVNLHSWSDLASLQ